ncbi:MAG TPA: AraC family transcriptional regulator [Saprospiraceae bacterium]|nr:AraC family transcriptional regulator [Saprospiraceae bacterium]HMP22977.1 AraC family transcriptional regulator [Saprospiraceae bacterium]
MKALSFRVPKTKEASFRVQIDEEPYFYDRLHYHPEWQITFIQRGRGTLFVGGGISRFQEGDVLAIGSNVPHLLKSDSVYYTPDSPRVAAVSLFFEAHSFGQGFFELPELQPIREWLALTARGIRVLGETRTQLQDLISNTAAQTGFQSLKNLLDTLYVFAKCKEYELLAHASFTEAQREVDGERLNNVLQFSLNNYQQHITLEDAAAVANLSVPAFCRYFKMHTRKSYLRFLHELRISAACKLLAEQKVNISQICYEVGFNNLSNFNRHFKKITGFTPSEYQKKMGS